MEKEIISCCNECPFYCSNEYLYCQHPNGPEDVDDDEESKKKTDENGDDYSIWWASKTVHSKCPLRNSPIEIQYSGKDNDSIIPWSKNDPRTKK